MLPAAPELNAVYTFQLPDGRWGACQIIAQKIAARDARVEVITLDYLEAKRPTPADVGGLSVLRQGWGAWEGKPARVSVEARAPWWVEKVAVVPALATFDTDCDAWGSWLSVLGAWSRDRWQARQKWAPPAGPAIEIEGVGQHPTMGEVRYEGGDARFAAYVAQRKVEELRWTVRDLGSIDLSGSCLTELSLTVSGPLDLKLPQTLTRLEITGPADVITVTGGPFDFPFRLAIISPRIVAPPKGMEDVRWVEYRALRDTDSAALEAYTRLAELILRGGPGRLVDASGLAKLTSLHELRIQEMYDLDPTHWPSPWPSLEAVSLRGVRKPDADALKKQSQGRFALDLSAVRTDAWMEKNLGNPFREWEDDDPTFGRGAMAAWKKASAAAKALGEKPKKQEAKAVLDALVVALNRVDAKHGIDTLRREEAAHAYGTLARGMGVTDAEAEAWLDALRAW